MYDFVSFQVAFAFELIWPTVIFLVIVLVRTVSPPVQKDTCKSKHFHSFMTLIKIDYCGFGPCSNGRITLMISISLLKVLTYTIHE